MKGVVFVELIEMAESLLGEAAMDEVLDGCPFSNGGAFTRVGTYPCSDLIALVEAIGARTATPPEALQRRYGHWLMAYFARTYPALMAGHADALSLLEAIEGEVHVEVRKLYPDAELPGFDCDRLGPRHLRMTYRSPRPLAPFCHGLIEACLAHFATPGHVSDLGPVPGEPRSAVFDIRLDP